MKLSALDLNLLVALRALIEERHVSRAAQRIGLSQPAMSNALARLRQVFNDDILVRTPQGMQLTTKALALAGPVGSALAQLEQALDDEGAFHPGQVRCTFTVAMSDLTSLVILPALQRRLSEQAPDMDLMIVHSVRGQGLAMIERGEVDLAIGRLPDPPPHMRSQIIFRDRLVCMARAGHPAFRPTLSLLDYVAAPHLQVRTPNDPSFVDRVLEGLSVKRHVKLILPHYLMVPLVLAETNLIATEPERLALRFQQLIPLVIQPTPFEFPMYDMSMAWHSRADRNSAHCWLRDQIVQVGARP